MKQVGILQVDKRQNSSVYSMNWVWWFMSVIPATREAEVRGSWSMSKSRQKYETLSEKLKIKRMCCVWLEW
jgi:hypothetical protein